MVINKRQAEQPNSDQFFLFGQILSSLGKVAPMIFGNFSVLLQKRIFLFVPVLTACVAGGLLGTAAEEGGQFLDRQVEVNQPIVETVHNISDTIGGSEFVQGSTRTAPQIVGTKLGLAHSTAQVRSYRDYKIIITIQLFQIFSSLSCLLLCPHSPAGSQREACQQQHCTP